MSDKQKTYVSAEAFRAALEAKARAEATQNGIPLDIARRARAFEAFLLRVKDSGQPVVVKGGFAMYVRYSAFARPTRDLDMAVIGDKPAADDVKKRMHTMLDTIGKVQQPDFFTFLVGESSNALGGGREFEGFRFPVEARIGGRKFDSFHVDMTIGDAILKPLDTLPIGRTLSFAGIPEGEVEAIGVAQHYSEKLHAYVRERGGRENSRVKDLFDMVYFIRQGVEPMDVAAVVAEVFRQCGGPYVPDALESPPRAWKAQYEHMVAENGLNVSFDEALSMIREFHKEMLSQMKERK